jgi:hypothetical protein
MAPAFVGIAALGGQQGFHRREPASQVPPRASRCDRHAATLGVDGRGVQSGGAVPSGRPGSG